MYNQSIKERYINEKESTTFTPEGYLPRLFNKTEEFESRYGKDVSSFTVYEIIDFYKTMNVSSLESLNVINSHLTLYVDWCLKQNMVDDCQNHFTELNNDMLFKCINKAAINKSIITKDTLYNWFTIIPNASDAFIMIALFEGIKGKEFCEIANLKYEDFDLERKTVMLCTGRELTVSDKLIKIAKESFDSTDYYPVGGTTERKMPLLNEPYIVKNYPNCQVDISDFHKGRRIYRKLLRNFEFLGVAEWMKPNSLTESGKIDYINRRSEELSISGKDFIYSDYAKEIEDRYGYDMKRLRVSYIRKFGEHLV